MRCTVSCLDTMPLVLEKYADEAVTVNIIIKHGRCVSPDGNVPSELQANCNTDSSIVPSMATYATASPEQKQYHLP